MSDLPDVEIPETLGDAQRRLADLQFEIADIKAQLELQETGDQDWRCSASDNGRRYNAIRTMRTVHDIMEYLRVTIKDEECGNSTLSERDIGYNYAIDRITGALSVVDGYSVESE